LTRYKRGEESRERILKAAKECFAVYGYKKTTVAMIASKVDVPQSLVTYYYKKDEFLSQIYEDYIMMVIEEIDRQVGQLLENSLQRHLLLMQVQYLGIYSDENSYAIYRYIVEKRPLSAKAIHAVDGSLMNCIRDFQIDLDQETFQMYISAQYGAHRELTQLHLPEYDPEKGRKLFYFTGTIALRLAGVSRQVIDENIRKADELLAQMELSHIRLLDCRI